MKKILCGFIAILCFAMLVSPLQAATVTRGFGLTVEANETLTLTVPPDQSITLIQPMVAGNEAVATGLQIILEGNSFTVDAGDALVTVKTDNVNPDYNINWTNGTIVNEGDLNATSPATGTIGVDAQSIATEDVGSVVDGSGKVTFTFDLIINKLNAVSSGWFYHSITVDGADDGSINP